MIHHVWFGCSTLTQTSDPDFFRRELNLKSLWLDGHCIDQKLGYPHMSIGGGFQNIVFSTVQKGWMAEMTIQLKTS